MFHYKLYGLNVASTLDLGLETTIRYGIQPADVILVDVLDDIFSKSLTDVEVADPEGLQEHLPNGDLYFNVPGSFEFLALKGGRAVLCHRYRQIDERSLGSYFTTIALSCVLYQRHEEAIHATVIKFEDRVIGLVGPSGTGKSTLASHLLSNGGRLLTDDFLRVGFARGQVLAYPGPSRLKLFPQMAEKITGNWTSKMSQSVLSGKLLLDIDGTWHKNKAIGLDALVWLDTTMSPGPQSVAMKRLSGVEAFKIVAASTINRRIWPKSRMPAHFRFVERLIKKLPVFRLSYPKDYSVLDQVSQELRRALSC